MIWQELGLPAVIPFDETERQRQCAKALEILGTGPWGTM